jgi:hypothetical protein
MAIRLFFSLIPEDRRKQQIITESMDALRFFIEILSSAQDK